MKSIVTGGTGFIGKALVENLLSRGWEVFVLTRTRGKTKKIFAGVEELLPGDEFPRAEVLFNLAGAVKGRTYEDFRRANVEFTRAVLERAMGKVEKVVHLSSQAASGPSPDCRPVKEETQAPVSLYGRSKLEGEREVKNFQGPWAILRPPAVYGEGDYAFVDLYKIIKKGFAPWLGPRKFSLIYVKDLVFSLEAAAEKVEGEVLNVASQQEVDYWEFVLRIAEILGRKRVKKIPLSLDLAKLLSWFSERTSSSMFTRDKVRELSYPCWIIDTARAERAGILKHTPLREGLQKTLEWAQKREII